MFQSLPKGTWAFRNQAEDPRPPHPRKDTGQVACPILPLSGLHSYNSSADIDTVRRHRPWSLELPMSGLISNGCQPSWHPIPVAKQNKEAGAGSP